MELLLLNLLGLAFLDTLGFQIGDPALEVIQALGLLLSLVSISVADSQVLVRHSVLQVHHLVELTVRPSEQAVMGPF